MVLKPMKLDIATGLCMPLTSMRSPRAYTVHLMPRIWHDLPVEDWPVAAVVFVLPAGRALLRCQCPQESRLQTRCFRLSMEHSWTVISATEAARVLKWTSTDVMTNSEVLDSGLFASHHGDHSQR